MKTYSQNHYHPIHNTKYIVSTPAMEKLRDSIQAWIYGGFIGGVIWGLPRCGKTTAFEVIADELQTRSDEPIAVYFHSAESFTTSTDLKFYTSLAFSLGLPELAGSSSTAVKYRIRLDEAFIESATHNNDSLVVLVIDEAQKLTAKHYEYLGDLYNRLRTKKVDLRIFSLGSLQLREFVENFSDPNEAHLRGRFFVKTMHFRGLTSCAEVKNVLSKYDSELRYPEDGPSFTEHFLPRAFDNGFRLSDLAEDIWHVTYQRAQDLKYSEIPMQYFCKMVDMLLCSRLRDGAYVDCDDRMINQMLDSTGFHTSVILY